MALFLSNEKMWDMPLDGVSDKKHITHWFGNFLFLLFAPFLKLMFRYRVDGRASLRAFKRRSGVVVICNHTSFLDVCFLYMSARWNQWIRLMGRDSLFEKAHGLLGQVLSRAGAFPVKRDSADRTSIKRATRFLKDKEIVGIMPEGTRRGKSDIEPALHAGAAFIARMGKVPILPCTVRNAELVKQKGKMMRFPKVTIEYGKPILLEDFDFLPKPDRLDGCTWYAMRECFAMFFQVEPEKVDMVKLFPTDKDFTHIFAEHKIPIHTSEEVLELMEASKQRKAELDKLDETSAELRECCR